MSDVVIGNASQGRVMIADTAPADGVYQSKEKISVVTPDGIATSDAAVVKAALAELGITSLPSGVKLGPLANYTAELVHAERSASRADRIIGCVGYNDDSCTDHYVFGATSGARNARDYAKQANLPIKEERLTTLVKTAFTNAYEAKLRSAEMEVAKSEYRVSFSVEQKVAQARDYAKQAGLPADEQRITTIIKAALTHDYAQALRTAAEEAERGNPDWVRQNLDYARSCASRAGLPIDEKQFAKIVQSILVKGYQATIRLAADLAPNILPRDLYWQQIKDPPLKPEENVVVIENLMHVARDFAQQAGIAVDEARIEAITTTGLINASEACLQEAARCARHWITVYSVESLVRDARSYAQRAGRSVDEERIGTIVQASFVTRYGAALDKAEYCMESGAPEEAEQHVRDAREYAERADISVDEERIRRILSSATKGCPPE